MARHDSATILRLVRVARMIGAAVDDDPGWDRLAMGLSSVPRPVVVAEHEHPKSPAPQRWVRRQRRLAPPRWILPFPRGARIDADLRQLLADLQREVDQLRIDLGDALDPTPRRPAA